MKDLTASVRELFVNTGRDAPGAFEQAYRYYYPLLLQYAGKYTSDESLAKDILQEVFWALYENRREVAGMEYPQAWLYKCVYNGVLKAKRAKRRGKRREQEYASRNEYYWGDDRQRRMDALLITLNEHINRLPSVKRRILKLRLAGMKRSAIARQCGIADGTVRNHIMEAYRLLRRAFGRDIDERSRDEFSALS